MFVYTVHGPNTVSMLLSMGLSRKAIARLTGISVRTLSRWGNPAAAPAAWSTSSSRCRIISQRAVLSTADLASYAYLLGLYLGDGHISAQRRGVYQLRVYMDSRYPRIIGETVRALRAVLPRNRVFVARRRPHNLVAIGCSSKALPTLFPQHGPGRKHSRQIRLADWQRRITFVHAEELVRGLIHSDGCRFIARQPAKGRIYRYARYCFSNRSADIMRIFCDHLDLLEVDWTLSDAEQAQIARREAVETLDEFVGPKR